MYVSIRKFFLQPFLRSINRAIIFILKGDTPTISISTTRTLLNRITLKKSHFFAKKEEQDITSYKEQKFSLGVKLTYTTFLPLCESGIIINWNLKTCNNRHFIWRKLFKCEAISATTTTTTATNNEDGNRSRLQPFKFKTFAHSKRNLKKNNISFQEFWLNSTQRKAPDQTNKQPMVGQENAIWIRN